jgi:hypothetical protein
MKISAVWCSDPTDVSRMPELWEGNEKAKGVNMELGLWTAFMAAQLALTWFVQ